MLYCVKETADIPVIFPSRRTNLLLDILISIIGHLNSTPLQNSTLQSSTHNNLDVSTRGTDPWLQIFPAK